MLEMKILSKDAATISANIYGCVLTRYSTHDYSSIHDKLYYQSILFNKSQVESVELTTESIIPLSKFLVVVPTDSSLIIVVDLWLDCIDNQNHEVGNGTVEFEVNLSGKFLIEIQGDHYCLLLCKIL